MTYRGPTIVDGLEGLRVHSQATVAGKTAYFQHWLLLRADRSYQLILWGPDKRTVAEEIRLLALRLNFLHSRADATVAPSPGPEK